MSKTPPFPMDDSADKVGEELKMTYRYLDLRRQSNSGYFKTSSQNESIDTQLFRLVKLFTEVETPMLFKSTPEGAREFSVPSRMNPIFMHSHSHLNNTSRCLWLQV